MDKPLLSLKNVEAGYGTLQILFDINLNVYTNEIVVLIGPNGAGKSTVLNAMYRLTDWRRGIMLYDGNDIQNWSAPDLVAHGCSMVSQGRLVFSRLSVKENLVLGGFILESSIIQERISHVVSLFPQLRSVMHVRSGSLSGGLQQMVALARALMRQPRLLMLDEPSLGLSPKLIQETFQYIQRLRDQGTTILMIEQNARQAITIADRVYLLEAGNVVVEGGKEILNDQRIKHVYLGGV